MCFAAVKKNSESLKLRASLGFAKLAAPGLPDGCRWRWRLEGDGQSILAEVTNPAERSKAALVNGPLGGLRFVRLHVLTI